MRVLVCGGRSYRDDRFMDWVLTKYPIHAIIEGEAPGADSMAREWAEAHGIPFDPFPANWKKYGKRAGHIRNTQMLMEGLPDLVIAFRGGSGTANMVAQSKTHKLPVIDL